MTAGVRETSCPAVLDAPPGTDVDPDELVRAAMRWHFSPETGSRFWLERAGQLDFDPRTDVREFGDLRMFPQVVDDLRDVPVEHLVPRGYRGAVDVVGVFESGGTTGRPKRVVFLADWMEHEMASAMRAMDARGYPRGTNWLSLGPAGPHDYAELTGQYARRRGGVRFAIDFDPRWVKRCLHERRNDEAERYLDHLMAQARDVLRSQAVGVLQAPPPLLVRLAQDEELVDLVRDQVRAITWCGTSFDLDTRALLREEVFPGIPQYGLYGSTIVLSAVFERAPLRDDECVFDPLSAHVGFTVVEPESGNPVPVGETGRVVMHHVSKSMLMPNVLERDLARRVEGLPGQVGHSLAEVRPVLEIGGVTVVEGAY
ncbi:phenazine antibiotic biosynthesis protein [Lentzea sp. NPDC004782]|uniref:phenazine antibiotic biosynthesis protein n=1 Tax=Lentzea sp. NPDC004782 TaxID=3154458 RepID=UPI0033B80E1F